VPDDGMLETYFIHPDDIEKYDLPKHFRGLNSVGRPHPGVAKELSAKNLTGLVKHVPVPVVSVGELLDSSGACRMGTFKVDVEGMDGDLLLGYSAWVLNTNRKCFADVVIGEFNHLAEENSFEMINTILSRMGYVHESDVSGKGDHTWRVPAAEDADKPIND